MRKYLGVIFLFLTANAHAIAKNYVGVDYTYLWLRGRDANNYAMRLVLPSNYNGMEIYAAHRFENDVGISIAWEQTRTKDITHAFVNNETFLGDPEQAGNSVFTSTQIRAFNIDVNGYVDITKDWEAVGQLGFSFMEANMEGTMYSPAPSNLFPAHTYKPVPRIGLAVQYFFTKVLGVRVAGHWVGTNMFHLKITDEDGVRRNIKPFIQSWSASIGIVGRW